MANGVCGMCKFAVLDPTHWSIGQMWCTEKQVFCSSNSECSSVIPKEGVKPKTFQPYKSK